MMETLHPVFGLAYQVFSVSLSLNLFLFLSGFLFLSLGVVMVTVMQTAENSLAVILDLSVCVCAKRLDCAHFREKIM